MDFFDKVKYKFDQLGYIKKLIDKWEPQGCKTEKDYEKSLYLFLHEQLPETQITKQYAKGRIKADIAVDDKIIIELKNNLKARNNFQRLLGQLTEYKSWKGSVIILLTGETDLNFVKELKSFCKKESNTVMEEEKFVLCEKT